MPRPTPPIALLACALCLPLGPALAQGVFVPPDTIGIERPQTGIRASVARDLDRYGYPNVDVRRLSVSQVAAIHHLAHSNQSEGDIRSHIAATLRRGLLQRGFDRVFN